MKTVILNVDDRVVTIKNGNLRKGIIRRIYADIPTPILIVEFDDGEIEKVYPGDVALEPKTEVKEDQEVKEEKKPAEKSEITITLEEFREISVKTAIKVSDGDFKLGLLLSMFSSDLAKVLFEYEGDNE